jgi:nucleoside-diphosphate-sugar epimerase
MARVIRAALEARVPRVIHVSSVAAYQRRTREVRVGEDWPLGGIPSSAYSTDKARG